MAYKCSFLDNESYAADDVNRALAALTTQGVSLFVDTGTVLMDLNTAINNVATSGVTNAVANACKVTVTDGAYAVSPGTCILPDGTMLMVDADGVELTITANAVNYVFVQHNAVENTINIVVSASAGADGTVPLATIAADGTVSDTRQYARAKIQCAGAPTFTTLTVTLGNSIEVYKEVETNRADFTYCIWNGYVRDSIEKIMSAVSTDSANPTDVCDYRSSYRHIYMYKQGTKLYIKPDSNARGSTLSLEVF